MEQYALLRQKAELGEQENAAFLASIGNSTTPANPDNLVPESEWDLTVEEAQARVRAVGAETVASTDEERAYYKAVSGSKRGDSALTDHLNQKASRSAKRARIPDDHQFEMGGVPISNQNAHFNHR